MKSGILKNTVSVLIIILAVSGIGTCLTLCSLTLVDAWLVAAVAVIAAFPVSALLARKDRFFFSFSKKYLRLAVWLIIIPSVLAGVFYALNYIGADENDITPSSATVENKYYKERQRTRRVGRGRYIATGEKYKVHYADIRLAGGHMVTVSLTQRQANDLRMGQQLEVAVAQGGLSVPVVLRKSIFNPQSKI